MNLKDLLEHEHSLWLDYIARHLVRSGELEALIRDDGIRGLTSNPSIFEKAIAASADYDEAIAKHAHRSTGELYEHLAVADIQSAADLFRPLYEASEYEDGFVCLEVSPAFAYDVERTVVEARRLWARVGRDNVMIKVPGTDEGIIALAQLLSEGINVNVTLLFSRDVYARVAEAHMAGLEACAARGGDLRRLASVASFFVSRIDVAVDRRLEESRKGASRSLVRTIDGLLGKAAIANARLAYQDWKRRVGGTRWTALAARGAQPQRLLWASTSTKDPRLSDVYYVEALIGPHTVDTVPPSTLAAFRDHGHVAPTLEQDLEAAQATLAALEEIGISLREVTAQLVVEGLEKFSESFEHLMVALDEKRRAQASPAAASQASPRGALGLPSSIDACLFDLDGVLTRTARLHAEAWKQTFDAYLLKRSRATGEPFVPFDAATDYQRYVDGKLRLDGVRSFLASRAISLPDGNDDDARDAETAHGLAARKDEVFVELLRQTRVATFDGSVRYVRAARDAGLRTAVVSSSKHCRDVLVSAGIADLFDAEIDGNVAVRDHLAGKPAPDTYLAAARVLGVSPSHAAIFEDALAGVEAGRGGHFGHVVGVDRVGHAAELRRHGADVVVTDLAALLEAA